MTDITQTLKDEHQNILRVLQVAEQKCTDMEHGKAIDSDFFLRLFDFISIYADKFHHAKEEDVLFKAMLENAQHLHCNPVPVMLYEHDEGRKFLQEMRHALAQNQKQELLFATRCYIDLLSNHIYKEDQVLYPMAEEAISEEEKQLVNQQYAESEKRVKAAFDVEELLNWGLAV
ncbi:MAG: hemerythrin domain-containing protein [Mangrovibacterium sp.]